PGEYRDTRGDQPKAQPVRRGPRADVQAVGPDALQRQADKAISDEIYRQHHAVPKPDKLRSLEDDPAQRCCKRKIEQGFIEEGRMERGELFVAGGSPGGIDRHGPRQVGRRPERFLVRPVSPAANRLAEGKAWRDCVHPEPGRFTTHAGIGDDDECAGDDRAMDGKTATTEVHRASKILAEPVPLEDDVVEARPDDRAEYDPWRHIEQEIGIMAPLAGNP